MSVYFVVHAELSELSPPMTPRLKRNRFPFGNHGSRESTRQKLNLVWPTSASGVSAMALPMSMPGDNCIKLGLPGKSILRDYFQENITFRRPFLLLRISFPGRPIFLQFVPGSESAASSRRILSPFDAFPFFLFPIFVLHSSQLRSKIIFTFFRLNDFSRVLDFWLLMLRHMRFHATSVATIAGHNHINDNRKLSHNKNHVIQLSKLISLN